MAAVGLLFVGVVLIVNGLFLLGVVEPRSAAPLNLFVGAMQVLTPTYLIFTTPLLPTGQVNWNAILSVAGIYLFGFTYLYVGINLLANLDGSGLGWYSIFVTCVAWTFAGLNFAKYHSIASFDRGFGVIWAYWGFLWALFWVILGLKREEWTRYTGAIAIVAGVFTTGIPGLLLLTGQWAPLLTWWTTALVIILVVSVFAALPLRTRYRPVVPPSGTAAEEFQPGEVPAPRTAEERARYESEYGQR